jgi:hypothetical protein
MTLTKKVGKRKEKELFVLVLFLVGRFLLHPFFMTVTQQHAH